MNHPLYQLLADLEEASIYFVLNRTRSDSVLVSLTLAGERVEVDVFEDGHMEVARFRGDESIEGDQALVQRLIEENRD